MMALLRRGFLLICRPAATQEPIPIQPAVSESSTLTLTSGENHSQCSASSHGPQTKNQVRSPRVPGVWLQRHACCSPVHTHTHTRHLFWFAAASRQKPWALWWHHQPQPNTCSSALPPSTQLSQRFCSADISQLSGTLSSSTLQFHRAHAATCTHAPRLNKESDD